MKPIALSCVFLCYNESESIASGVAALARVCSGIGVENWEAVIVDDGSTDSTAQVVESLEREELPVRRVPHEGNLGYGRAMRTALSECRGDWLFLTDGDRQFFEEDLARLWQFGQSGEFDFIQGYRVRRADPWARKVIGAVYRAIVKNAFGLPIRDPECAFRLVRRGFCAFSRDNGRDEWKCQADLVPVEWILKAQAAGARFCEVGVRHRSRAHGASKAITFRELKRLVPEFVSLSKSLEESV